MPRTITVRVTQEDIQDGVACSNYHCPVARAIRRLVANGNLVSESIRRSRWGVEVDHTETFILDAAGGPLLRAALPGKAAQLAKSFDRNLPVTPLTFSLTFEEV